MKPIYVLFLGVFSIFSANAQYSSNPATPFKVCQQAGNQLGVQAFNKGNYTYTYWLDNRSGKNEIYGQKLDAAGIPQWTGNGKLIASMSSAIQAMRVMDWQNGTFVSYMTLDSSLCKYIDDQGIDVWAQPVLVAKSGNGVIYMENTGYSVFPNDSGVTITHATVYTGGTDLFTFNRIAFNGQLRWSPLTFNFTLQGYDYRTVSDNQNGFYVLSKGNGLGSTMYIKRYDFQGNAVWPSTIDITSGNSAIGFGGNISMMTDAASNLFVCWEGNQGSIQLTKISSAGTFAWPNLRTLVSSSTALSPRRPDAKLVKDKLFVTWIENTTTDALSMLQYVDSSGTILWANGGIAVDTVNYMYANPKLALSDSNAVVVFAQGIPGVYFDAQRVRTTGSLSWLPGGRYLSKASGDWVANADYIPLDDPINGCNVVAWSTSSTTDIAAAQICSNGSLVSISEPLTSDASVTCYPNPAIDQLAVSNLQADMKALRIYDLHGKLLLERSLHGESYLQLSLRNFTKGMYLIRITGEGETPSYQQKLIIE